MLPRLLATIYTNEVAVVALASALVPIAGVFQVFDGLQVVASGVLRGAADTRVPMYINLVGFWLIAVPASWALGFLTPLGPLGMWWGLGIGLFVVGTALLIRAFSVLRRKLERVRVETQVS